jgi:hypothetical protein
MSSINKGAPNMADKVVIERDGKVYEIAVDQLAQYEVIDEGKKQELRDAGEDEVEGFMNKH